MDSQLDWSGLTERGGDLFVPFAQQPDQAWARAFAAAATQSEHETRGQTWDAIEIAGDLNAVVVIGVDPETKSDHLAEFLEQLVSQATAEAPRERQREAEQDREEEQTEAAGEAIARLADELRRRPH